jgi:hypothetical protein
MRTNRAEGTLLLLLVGTFFILASFTFPDGSASQNITAVFGFILALLGLGRVVRG